MGGPTDDQETANPADGSGTERAVTDWRFPSEAVFRDSYFLCAWVAGPAFSPPCFFIARASRDGADPALAVGAVLAIGLVIGHVLPGWWFMLVPSLQRGPHWRNPLHGLLVGYWTCVVIMGVSLVQGVRPDGPVWLALLIAGVWPFVAIGRMVVRRRRTEELEDPIEEP